MFLAIRVAPAASVASPGYLTMVRFSVRSFRKPRMVLANVSLANKKKIRTQKNRNMKECARVEKKVYDHKSSRDGLTKGTSV